MRSIVCALILFCVLPSYLNAREIRVRSGEHEGYSRLVIYTRIQDQPRLETSGDALRITTAQASDTFNISSVFDLIPRTRIKSASEDNDGSLRIKLGCECDVRTEQLEDGLFVIDIADASSRQQFGPAMSSAHAIKPAQLDHPSQARIGLPIAAYDAPVFDTSEPGANRPNENLEQAPPDEGSTRILDQEKLLAQLSRATSQGLLTPKQNAISALVPSAIQDEVIEVVETPPTEVAPTPKDHLSVQTSVDRDTKGVSSALPMIATDATCLPAQSFSIADWGADTDGKLDFSFGHLNLVTELDGLDPTAFLRFLRHQLYLTLGAEALTQLDAYPDDLPERANIAVIAQVIEGDASGSDRIATQIHCDGPVALWATLSTPRLNRDAAPNTAAVLTEFSALPRHLRAHLGPMLMRKYLSIGDTANAMEINRITERGAVSDDMPDTLVDAQISLATDEVEKATDALSDIVDQDDHDAIDAIILLVETNIESQTGISDRTLELLASLAHEHRASKDGYRLALAEVDALTHTARFMDVEDSLRSLREFSAFDQNDYSARVASFGIALSEKASNAVFLRNIIGHPDWQFAPEETRLNIAARLVALGFLADARGLLATDAEPPGRAARQIIAQISLLEDKPKVALGYLAGLSDEKSQALRKAALLEIGTEQQVEPPSDATALRTQNAVEEAPSLTRYRALLDESKGARSQVETWLSAAPIPSTE